MRVPDSYDSACAWCCEDDCFGCEVKRGGDDDE